LDTFVALAPVLLGSDSVAGQSSFLRDIPPGKYEGIVVRFSGDALAAQTFAVTDLGRIRLTEAGRDIVAADADNLRFMNMLNGGHSRVQAVAGAASAATILLPRGFGDNNVHQIIEADVAQIVIQMGANFTAKFTGADVAQFKIYGLVRETGEMAYNMLIHQIDQNLSSGVFTLPLRHENVIAIYPVINTNLSRVRIVKDGEEMVNVQQGGATAQDNDLVAISDLLNQTDAPDTAAAFAGAGLGPFTTDSSIAELAIAEPGEIGEFLSDDVVVEFTMVGAQVQEILVLSADFTPTKLRQTKVETASVVQRKVARKNTLGRGRPVQTLRIASE
jgi:hypothetical protein